MSGGGRLAWISSRRFELDHPLDLRKKAQSAGLVFKPLNEKLLDEPEAPLYCDHELDRQLAISLS
jgi:hypothetical protein